ncbi:MAG: JAB domain-containing protein [Verrucomicrobiota bacterium]|jgi:DNA repair protein RadC
MKITKRVHRKDATKSAPYQLKIPAELKVVRLRECPVADPIIDKPHLVVDFWRKHVVTASWFRDFQECLCVFLFNTRHRLIGFELIGLGTLDSIWTTPREVFRTAILHNAFAVVIAHNHPSGDPTPSESDIKITRELIRAGQYLRIDLLDHIILGDARRENGYASLRAMGYFYS